MPQRTDFELRTMPGLWRWYETASRQLTFQPGKAVEDWQAQLREVLTRLLGGFDYADCEPNIRVREMARETDLQHEMLMMQVLPGEHMPFYVLTPHNSSPPYRPIIVLHGHGTWGAKSLIGQADSLVEAEFMQEFHLDYARKLALEGFQVFVPFLRGMSDRMEGDPDEIEEKLTSDDPWQNSCQMLGLNLMLTGKTLLGLRVWDVMRLAAYIQTRPDVLPDHLGCVGFSGGGTLTLFAAALMPQITCAYISGSLNTFRHSLMVIQHCLCNYIPGILQYAEMADIAGLIAPRPLFIEAGAHDPIYPVAGVEAALATLRPIYEALNASDRLDSLIFDGVHEWNGSSAGDWFQRWL